MRRAESNTRSTNVIPSANHRTAVTTCMAVQLGRRPAIAVAASFAVVRRADDAGRVSRRSSRRASALLALRLAPLGVEAGLLGRPARLRWRAAGGSTCSAAARRERSRSSASSRLRACERLSDAVARATGPSRSSSRARWRGPSDGRRRDREPHLDPRVGRVGVLAARSTGAGRAPLELVEADHARRRDPQHATIRGTLGGRAHAVADRVDTPGRVPISSRRMGDARGGRTT